MSATTFYAFYAGFCTFIGYWLGVAHGYQNAKEDIEKERNKK